MKNGNYYVLGVPNFANYESSTALIEVPRDGGRARYICISEDRLTREKFTYTFPLRGIDYCLNGFGLDSLDQVDLIATDYARLPRWINSGPGYRKLEHDYLKLKLDYPRDRIVILDHHDAHAASAFFPSGFEEAAVLVVDGMGSALNTQTLYHGKGHEVETLERGFGWGIGKLYALVTGKVLPYGPEKGFGKVMGLAPYGREHPGPVLAFASRDEGMTTDYSAFYSRQPVSRIVAKDVLHCEDRTQVLDPAFARAAFDVQEECERQLIRMAEYAHAETGCSKLCLAGGVALNGRANHLIVERTPIEEVWTPPCCSDTGVPFGLALLAARRHLPAEARTFQVRMPHAYTGRIFQDDEVRATLEREGVTWQDTNPDEVADLIADQRIVAWFDGGSEFGPRALGHRSILADPRGNATKDHLNATVKFRESYRPYAPSVLAEHARDWCDLLVDSPFMLMVCTVKEDKRAQVPAITHVDGTARIQEVSREDSPNYWALIDAFRRRTGVPLLLNTSFNVNREPIVETVEDALICAFRTAIDFVVFQGRYLVDCAQYRDPSFAQGLVDRRAALDSASYDDLCRTYILHYDNEEMDAYLERENAVAGWYISQAPLYELQKLLLDWIDNEKRILVWGTPGHTQVLYEYVPDFDRVTVAACVHAWPGPGEPGQWPPDWPVIRPDEVDWDSVDAVFVSSHEYQRECMAALGETPCSVRCIYDTAMDSLYYTLPEHEIRLRQISSTISVQPDFISSIDEVGAPETGRSLYAERYAFISNYHYVRNGDAGGFSGLIGITPKAFEEQCARLVDNFAFVTASELVDSDLRLDESVGLVTFDDALRDVIDGAAPILAKFGIRATVFVPTLPYVEGRVLQTHKRQLIQGKLGAQRFQELFYERLAEEAVEREPLDWLAGVQLYRFDDEETRRFKTDLNYALPVAVVDRILEEMFVRIIGDERDAVSALYLSRDDLARLLDAGWEIGGHGHMHVPLARWSPECQRSDVETNKGALADMLGQEPVAFAYPFGNSAAFNAESIDALNAAGYQAAFTTAAEIVRPSHLEGRYTIPRFDNQDLFDRENVLRRHLIEMLSTGD